jgi:hypothetical protein
MILDANLAIVAILLLKKWLVKKCKRVVSDIKKEFVLIVFLHLHYKAFLVLLMAAKLYRAISVPNVKKAINFKKTFANFRIVWKEEMENAKFVKKDSTIIMASA